MSKELNSFSWPPEAACTSCYSQAGHWNQRPGLSIYLAHFDIILLQAMFLLLITFSSFINCPRKPHPQHTYPTNRSQSELCILGTERSKAELLRVLLWTRLHAQPLRLGNLPSKVPSQSQELGECVAKIKLASNSWDYHANCTRLCLDRVLGFCAGFYSYHDQSPACFQAITPKYDFGLHTPLPCRSNRVLSQLGLFCCLSLNAGIQGSSQHTSGAAWWKTTHRVTGLNTVQWNRGSVSEQLNFKPFWNVLKQIWVKTWKGEAFSTLKDFSPSYTASQLPESLAFYKTWTGYREFVSLIYF